MLGNTLIAGIRTESMKQRRGLAAWLIPGAGLLVPAVIFGFRIRKPEALPALYRDESFWQRLSDQAWEPMAIMLLPLAAILVTSFVTQIEYRDNAWKQVHAAPVPPASTYIAKLVVAVVMVIEIVALFHVGLVLAGVLPRLLVAGVPYPVNPLPLREFVLRDLGFIADVLPIVGLQFLIGLLLTNVIAPIGIGLALWTAAISAINWKYNYVLLYGFNGIDHMLQTGKRVGRGTPMEISRLGLLCFVVTAVAGYVAYRAKPEKG